MIVRQVTLLQAFKFYPLPNICSLAYRPNLAWRASAARSDGLMTLTFSSCMRTQSISGPSPDPTKRFTVLIVDDSAHCREPLARILRLNGYHTVSAQDGHEALEAMSHGPMPDLILLDLMMPRMDGMAFLNRL